MLLENKVAIVYGGGAITGAVARAFAREGARVFLAGRNQAKLEKLAQEIKAQGGNAEITLLDALDEEAVDDYVDSVAIKTGRIDITFNLIGYGDVQQPLTEISVADFLQPIQNALRSHFLTARAAVRHMIPRGEGVILAFGGGGPQTIAGLGGFKIALDAIEGLRRQWACELGKHGIRVVTIKTGGVIESMPLDTPNRAEIAKSLESAAQLPYTETFAEVGNAAAWVASDQARSITSTEINISSGSIVD